MIPELEAHDVELEGLLLQIVEAMPSITNWSLLMGVPPASHCSSLAGPPQNRGMLSYGSRPSLSFSRIRRRIAGPSTIVCVDQVGHPCLVKIDHMVRFGFRRALALRARSHGIN